MLHELAAASNRLDLEGWLGLFSADAKQFKRAVDADQLANVPSTRAYDQVGRRKAYAEVFASPMHGRFEVEHTITVGDLIASRGAFVFPDQVVHTLTIYRVGGGLIQDIWDLEQVKEDVAKQ